MSHEVTSLQRYSGQAGSSIHSSAQDVLISSDLQINKTNMKALQNPSQNNMSNYRDTKDAISVVYQKEIYSASPIHSVQGKISQLYSTRLPTQQDKHLDNLQTAHPGNTDREVSALRRDVSIQNFFERPLLTSAANPRFCVPKLPLQRQIYRNLQTSFLNIEYVSFPTTAPFFYTPVFPTTTSACTQYTGRTSNFDNCVILYGITSHSGSTAYNNTFGTHNSFVSADSASYNHENPISYYYPMNQFGAEYNYGLTQSTFQPSFVNSTMNVFAPRFSPVVDFYDGRTSNFDNCVTLYGTNLHFGSPAYNNTFGSHYNSVISADSISDNHNNPISYYYPMNQFGEYNYGLTQSTFQPSFVNSTMNVFAPQVSPVVDYYDQTPHFFTSYTSVQDTVHYLPRQLFSTWIDPMYEQNPRLYEALTRVMIDGATGGDYIQHIDDNVEFDEAIESVTKSCYEKNPSCMIDLEDIDLEAILADDRISEDEDWYSNGSTDDEREEDNNLCGAQS